MYTEILKSKGKEVVLIDEKFDAKTAPKFDKSNADKSKKYSNYDFRALKSKYGVDEVLFVNVNYGIMKKAGSYNWILRIVDNNGERYELKLDYTLSNMRKLMRSIRSRTGVISVHSFKQFENI